MSADELSPEDVWPVPPSWMFGCTTCARLYRSMREIQDAMAELFLTGERGVDWDPMDSGPGSRIRLARHMAAEHLDLLPDWAPECERCGDHRLRLARSAKTELSASAALVAAEHRAAHLFVPPRGLGLV
ncbi:hypothetical protein ACFWBF_28405 [Streptomyces sp. NPDC060028]|uniref:hypothetical protein n=1 Tax=Streptomyces sp. NPDC060028 TaxID=3347041 RepID=UPI003684314B